MHDCELNKGMESVLYQRESDNYWPDVAKVDNLIKANTCVSELSYTVTHRGEPEKLAESLKAAVSI